MREPDDELRQAIALFRYGVTLAVFRRHASQAAAAGETRSLSRLATGLPRNLTRSLTNLSEVTWQHQGEDINRRREREQGYDISF